MGFEERELDYAQGYFCVINQDNFVILSDCPDDLRKKLETDWPRVREETIKRHEEGIYNTAHDYF